MEFIQSYCRKVEHAIFLCLVFRLGWPARTLVDLTKPGHTLGDWLRLNLVCPTLVETSFTCLIDLGLSLICHDLAELPGSSLYLLESSF